MLTYWHLLRGLRIGPSLPGKQGAVRSSERKRGVDTGHHMLGEQTGTQLYQTQLSSALDPSGLSSHGPRPFACSEPVLWLQHSWCVQAAEHTHTHFLLSHDKLSSYSTVGGTVPKALIDPTTLLGLHPRKWLPSAMLNCRRNFWMMMRKHCFHWYIYETKSSHHTA